jgi:hypothetical protein
MSTFYVDGAPRPASYVAAQIHHLKVMQRHPMSASVLKPEEVQELVRLMAKTPALLPLANRSQDAG